MSNVPLDRFQIGCSYCGHLCTEKTFISALRTANYQKTKHSEPYESITIYDLMAHVGKPDLYTFDGLVLSRKQPTSIPA